MAQPEVSMKICSLEEDIENIAVKLKETAEATAAVLATQKLEHTAELKQPQLLDVIGTIKLLQDSLGEQTQAVSAHKSEVACSLQEQSKQMYKLEESFQQIVSRTDALEDQTRGITLAQQQPPALSIASSISSMQQAAHKTNLEQQQLSAEVQRLSAAVSASDLPDSLHDLHAKMTAFQQNIENIAGDVDSQQQRTENFQRSNHAVVADLTALVRRQEDEIQRLGGRVDFQTAQAQEHVSAGNDDHALQLTKTMNLVSGTDEKLSALNEVLLNTKADTAEMREILRVAQSAQHQLADDLLHVRIGLEDRIESLEGIATHADARKQHEPNDHIKTLCTTLTEVTTEVAKLQQQNMDATNISPTEIWRMELSDRVQTVEVLVAALRESNLQSHHMESASSPASPTPLQHDESIRLNQLHTAVLQLQNDMDQLRGTFSSPECQSELNELVRKLQDQVCGMSLQITDLLRLKENAVTQEQLDALLSELESAMDDIANELDEIKNREGYKNETSDPCTSMSAGSQAQRDQLDNISADLKILKAMAVGTNSEQTQLQLEALGQRVRLLADDVEALGQQDGVNAKNAVQTALEDRLEQIQAHVATLGARSDQHIVHELVVRTCILHSRRYKYWLPCMM